MVTKVLLNPTGESLSPLLFHQLNSEAEDEVDAASTVLNESLDYSTPMLLASEELIHGLQDPPLQAVSDWNPELLYLILRGRVAVGAKDEMIFVSINEQGKIEGVMYINPPGTSHGGSSVDPVISPLGVI